MKEKHLKVTSPTIVKLLYQIVYDVKSVFEIFGIKYWAIGGTFLGAIRHKGIIPWDDDADLGIKKKDQKAFLALEPLFNELGYSLVKMFFGYKLYYTRRVPKIYPYSFPNLDIFIYDLDSSKKKYVPAYKKARDTWSKEHYSVKQIEDSEERQFGSYKITCPSGYKEIFDRYFGKDWNVVGYREYDHAKEEEVEKVKVRLTSKERVPAQPINAVRERRLLMRMKRNLT